MRLTINLPDSVHQELKDMARQAGVPMGILLRNSFAVAKIYYDAKDEGGRMIVETPRRTIEVVLP